MFNQLKGKIMSIRNKTVNKFIMAYDHKLPFVHFAPMEETPIRDVYEKVYTNITIKELDELLDDMFESPYVAFDYEANGTDIPAPEFRAVGLGFAWDRGRIYVPNVDDKVWHHLHMRMLEYKGWVGHNLMYDYAVYYKQTGIKLTLLADTFGMYKQICNEGFFGQRWGLKSAQQDLLLWENTNEVDLDEWLINNGYVKNGPTIKEDENIEDFKKRYFEWIKDPSNKARPDKSQMYLAPIEILGKYCVLDAEATYLLYDQFFLDILQHFPELKKFHENEFMYLLQTLCHQYLRGLRVDVEGLKEHRIDVLNQLEDTEKEIRLHPKCGKEISKWEKAKLNVHLAKEPTKYKKQKKLGQEPPKLRKDGQESKAWINWKIKKEEIENAEPEFAKSWLQWDAKRKRIEDGLIPAFRFNLGSSMQLNWLLFEKLYPYQIERESIPYTTTSRGQIGVISILNDQGKKVHLDMTKTGTLPTGDVSLSQMGEVGELINRYKTLKKELNSFIDPYISQSRYYEEEGIYAIHPGFIFPGTVTCRVSGSRPNLLQLPKSRNFLNKLIPRAGNVFVDVDFAAAEQVVLAHLSQDNSLMKLYGPDAKKNDVYLFVGSQLPVIGSIIRDAGYDPDDPTPEGIASAKKLAKNERSIAKVVVLASSYGAGAKKIFKTLRLSGIDIRIEQVEQIHKTYWDIFAGVTGYQEWLKECIIENGGFVTSELGFPVSVDSEKSKDTLNRMVQSTAHNLCVIWISVYAKMLAEEGLEWWPCVADWHDQSIVECRKEDADRIRQIMEVESFDKLNELLNWSVKFKGDGNVIPSIAEAKCED